MAIKYEFEIDGKMLKVSTSGKDDNLEEVESYARAILGLAIEHDCTKIFCDERLLEYSLSTLDTYQLAEAASKVAMLLRKIAIVCDQNYLEDGKFYETVASNRGLTVHVTADYDSALLWLKNE